MIIKLTPAFAISLARRCACEAAVSHINLPARIVKILLDEKERPHDIRTLHIHNQRRLSLKPKNVINTRQSDKRSDKPRTRFGPSPLTRLIQQPPQSSHLHAMRASGEGCHVDSCEKVVKHAPKLPDMCVQQKTLGHISNDLQLYLISGSPVNEGRLDPSSMISSNSTRSDVDKIDAKLSN